MALVSPTLQAAVVMLSATGTAERPLLQTPDVPFCCPQVSAAAIVSELLQKEGPSGLFKGGLTRMVWIAPVGAFHFGAYEIARNTIIHHVDRNSGKGQRDKCDAAASVGA